MSTVVPVTPITSRSLVRTLIAVALFAAACTGGGDQADAPGGDVGGISPPSTESGTPPQSIEPAPDIVPVIDQYDWNVLSSGAGGFVTGAATSNDGSTLLMRTDVGGAYRWDPATEQWNQLLNADTVPEPRIGDWGVESIAVAPNDPSRILMSVGGDDKGPNGRVLRSDDGGATWTSSAQDFLVDGNAFYRTNGERLAISAADANNVWMGTRRDGLWSSTDGGTNWTRNDAIPGDDSEQDAAGVLFVVADPTGSTIWAGVSQSGIWRSTDGGATFSLFSASEGRPFDAELGPDGRLWVTERDPGVIKIIDGDSITEVNPQDGRRWETVAVDPNDPNHVVVADEGSADHTYRTRDGGENWDRMEVSATCDDIEWLDSYSNDYLPTGSMLFDRNEAGKLWIPEGFGVWTVQLDDSNAFAMNCETLGIEELVSNDVVAPPGGDVVTAHWDRSIFWHGGDTAAEAIQGPTPRFNTAWDLDYSPSEPSFLVATVGDQRFCCEDDGLAYHSGYSNDGGRTWQRFASYDNGHPEDLRFGNIAVAAENTSNIVWLPTFNGAVHRSTDQGASWDPIILPGTEDLLDDNGVYRGGSHGQLFLNRKVLVADRIDPATFYLYHQRNGLYRSIDGGATWELQASEGLPVGWTVGFFNATLVASPTDPGHLLFTPGFLEEGAFPLYESRDAGATWTALPGTSVVSAVGFGAPAPDGDGATVYLYGTIEDGAGEQTGVWRSTDASRNWELVSPAPLGNYQSVKTISGDPDEFGTVYVGFTGTSFMVGRLVPAEN